MKGEDVDEMMSLKEAADRLGVSKPKMTRLVKARRFEVFENPLDAREKLVRVADVEALAKPRPIAQQPEEA